VIAARGLDVLFVTGPGHGGPEVVTTAWLKAPIPNFSRMCLGMPPGCARVFRQFSFPGGIPSHAAPETAGSIHEGGELGTRWRTPTAPRWTIRGCWWRA
jgi:xylulose-5-phosphate/fructose-6-phosphate phosphoketolase